LKYVVVSRIFDIFGVVDPSINRLRGGGECRYQAFNFKYGLLTGAVSISLGGQ
jgi:hypothetical protein